VNIVLLGPPGAGKGTQAKVLARQVKLPHVSTGDLLRANVAEGTDLGRQAKDFMVKGLLVPDTLIQEMLRTRLGRDDVGQGFILDGYPRTLRQAQALDDIMSQFETQIDFVFNLKASEAVIIQRLSGRLVCSSCQANFHRTNMPPKAPDVCDACGGGLYQRSDDKEETIRKRLQVYAQESAPVIEYYRCKGTLHEISADDDAQGVLIKILALIGSHNGSLKV
jgi:adenylate kinase